MSICAGDTITIIRDIPAGETGLEFNIQAGTVVRVIAYFTTDGTAFAYFPLLNKKGYIDSKDFVLTDTTYWHDTIMAMQAENEEVFAELHNPAQLYQHPPQPVQLNISINCHILEMGHDY